ncbi:MAG: FAD-linked oxidase C-terminal domain-containing protein [Acidobacteriota bacterium]
MSDTMTALPVVDQLPISLERDLRQLLGDRFSDSPSVRDVHGRDESYFPPRPPAAVVFPETTEEVSEIVRLAAADAVPLVPFGAGSSVEGHVLPVCGGISVDMTRMDRVLAVRPDDMDVTVEAGVTRKALERRLAEHGLFFPIDPGADATLGGMTATGASGTNAVRYGTMRENVLALRVVLADGTIVDTGSRARKSSSGYDLTRLLVGSEGTLGIITEITLRVHGLPEARSSAVVSFPSVDEAVATAVEIIQWGIPVARVELLDELQISAVNQHSGLSLDEVPTLFLEFHGSERSVEEQAETAEKIALEHGGTGFRWATDAATRAELWQARHDVYFADLALRPGARVVSTDVCVPISRLAECIRETKAQTDRASFPIPLVGHVGDGNFHLLMVIDPENSDELDEAKRLNAALVQRALAMGGTATGEHGIGLGKRMWLGLEHGAAVDVMRAVKRTLDPVGILNPGKLFFET